MLGAFRLMYIASILLAISIWENSHGYTIVLCYHEIGYNYKNVYNVLPEMFIEHIKLAKKIGINIVDRDFLLRSFNPSVPSLLVTFDDGWKINNKILKYLEEEKVKPIFFIYPKALGGRKFFSEKDLRKLQSLGFEIGSHSYSHILLKNLDEETLYREIVYSKEVIESITSNVVRFFAYPYGVYDKKAYLLASETYDMSFRVSESPVKSLENHHKVNRYIVYNITTLGILKGIFSKAFTENPLDYSSYSFGKEKTNILLRYGSSEVYHFPVYNPESSILIIPSVPVGPGWAVEMIKRFRDFSIEVLVYLNRTYVFSFYLAELHMEEFKSWGLQEMVEDFKEVLKFLYSRKKKFYIVTWGDGFDFLIALIRRNKNFANLVKGIFVISPSDFFTLTRNDLIQQSYFYKNLIENKKYVFESLTEINSIYAYLNMAFVKPFHKSPFNPKLRNIDAFIKALSMNKYFNVSFNEFSENYILDFVRELEYTPLPLSGIVWPTKYYLDLTEFYLSSQSNIADLLPNTNSKIVFFTTTNLYLPESVEVIQFTNKRSIVDFLMDVKTADEIIRKIR